MKKYKTEDNTADIAISAKGKTIEELFVNLALGLIEEMVDVIVVDRHACPLQYKFIIPFTDYENALIQFLNKIIYLIDVENKVPQEVNLKFEKNSLNIKYYFLKPEKIIKKRYIKAATYYDVKIEKTKNEFKTKVVFDV